MAVETVVPRSRRTILAAAAGSVVGFVAHALGRPGPAQAAAGDTLKLGQANDSGTSQTTLANAGLGAAFTLQTANTSGGATGIFGWSSNTGANITRGVYGRADGPNSHGVVGRQSGSAGTGVGVYGDGLANTGVFGRTTTGGYGVVGINEGVGGSGIYGRGDDTGIYGLAHGSGSTGVLGLSDATVGVGVYGWASAATTQNYGVYGKTDSPTGWGVYSDGDLYCGGDFFASGSKVGYVADVAVNGSGVTLHQGDAVKVIGVRPAVLGRIPLLVVGPARAGEPIIGIVDRLAEVTVGSRPRDVAGSVAGNVAAVAAIHGRGTTVKPDAHLLVVTMGAFAVASADASAGAIAVGDELAVGATAGKLAKSKGSGRSAGYALGELGDGSGTIGIFVSPH